VKRKPSGAPASGRGATGEREAASGDFGQQSSDHLLKDAEGRYLYVNHQFGKLTSLTPEQILGKQNDEIFPPELAAAFRRMISRCSKPAWRWNSRKPPATRTNFTPALFPSSRCAHRREGVRDLRDRHRHHRAQESGGTVAPVPENEGCRVSSPAASPTTSTSPDGDQWISELMLPPLPVEHPHSARWQIRQAGEKASRLIRH